jgi:hypothetical protein
VAVARKLAVLAWYLLTKDTDYLWSPATLTADKVRRLELLAGAPRRFELRGTFRDARAERSRARSLERAALETAEQAYRELVGSRTKPIARPAADAAAAARSD